MSLVWIVVILFTVLFIGFIMIIGSAVMNYVFDVTVPELSNLGVIDGTNMTNVASYTIAPVNTIIQSLTWWTGVFYVMILIGSVGVAFALRMSSSRWLIGLYIPMVLMLIIGAIFISNMYEEFYVGTDDLALRLKEHTILSYMVLYSPEVFTIIAFLTGIILFTGVSQEEYV